MKVFYCRNCGFFRNWEDGERKEYFSQDHEGFSPESMERMKEIRFGKMEIHCPVCPEKGLLTLHGATVKYELTARKIQLLIVRKFYYPEIKR